MRTLNLTIGERLMGIRILNETGSGKLTLAMLKEALEVLKRIAITEEDKKQVGWTEAENRIQWDEKSDKARKIELSEDQYKLLKDLVEARDTNKGFSIAEGKLMIDFCDKILTALKS